MDDTSLTGFLGLTPEEGAVILPGITTERRAAYVHMADVVADLNMGVVPDGVIVCRPRRGR